MILCTPLKDLPVSICLSISSCGWIEPNKQSREMWAIFSTLFDFPFDKSFIHKRTIKMLENILINYPYLTENYEILKKIHVEAESIINVITYS